MGSLVRNWIIHKMGLPVPEVSEAPQFERGLSNGRLIAEILRKYGIISDDQLITLGHNFTEATKIKNMKLIHRWMVLTGIPACEFADLLDVAEEKPGAILRLLYKLYFALEGGTHQGPGHGGEWSTESPPGDLADDATDTSPKSKFLPPAFDTGIDAQLAQVDMAGDNIAEIRKSLQKALEQEQGGDEEEGDGDGEYEDEGEVDIDAEEEGDNDVEFEVNVIPEVEVEVRFDVDLPPLPGDDEPPEVSFKLGNLPGVVGSFHSSDDSFGPPLLPCVSGAAAGRYDHGGRGSATSQLDSLVEERLHECPLMVGETVAYAPDTRDAAKLYFGQRAIQQVKRWGWRKPEELPDLLGDCATIDFSSIPSAEERLRLGRLKAKVEAEHRLVQEMGAYDAILDEGEEAEAKLAEAERQRRMADLTSGISTDEDMTTTRIKIHPRSALPIQPNPLGMRVRLNRLKCSRREEEVASEDRSRLRRSLAAILIQNISLQVHADLVQTVLSSTEVISGKEEDLRAFLTESYKPKEIFLDHIRHEGVALASLRMERSEREAGEREAASRLEEEVEALTTAREARIQDESADREMDLLRRFIRKQLDLLIRLATRIGDYRDETGEDPPPSLVEEWKAWLLLGLETPPGGSSDSEMEFDLRDGNCNIFLSEAPIPLDLNPRLKKRALEEAEEERRRRGQLEPPPPEDEEEEEEEQEEEEQEEEQPLPPPRNKSGKKKKGKKTKGGKSSKKLGGGQSQKGGVGGGGGDGDVGVAQEGGGGGTKPRKNKKAKSQKGLEPSEGKLQRKESKSSPGLLPSQSGTTATATATVKSGRKGRRQKKNKIIE